MISIVELMAGYTKATQAMEDAKQKNMELERQYIEEHGIVNSDGRVPGELAEIDDMETFDFAATDMRYMEQMFSKAHLQLVADVTEAENALLEYWMQTHYSEDEHDIEWHMLYNACLGIPTALRVPTTRSRMLDIVLNYYRTEYCKNTKEEPTMTLKFEGITKDNRKNLVTTLANILGVKPIYTGLPTKAYNLGEMTIDADGVLVVDGLVAADSIVHTLDLLAAKGFALAEGDWQQPEPDHAAVEKRAREADEATDAALGAVKGTKPAPKAKKPREATKKAEKKPRTPASKIGGMAFSVDGVSIILTPKQISFIQTLPLDDMWENGLDSELFCDMFTDTLRDLGVMQPMTSGAMVTTLREKSLLHTFRCEVPGIGKRTKTVCKFALTDVGKKVAAQLGVSK